MASFLKQKKDFLAVYNYGMGGVWFVFFARSANEIEKLYPFLKVFDDRPKFITVDDLEDIRRTSFQDIDMPTGFVLSGIRANLQKKEE